MVAGVTPVEPDLTHVRFAFTQRKDQVAGERAGVSRALVRDICKQLDQDKVVWDRQHYLKEPLLCEGDGPIADFRRYYAQFYAEWPGGGSGQRVAKRSFARKGR